MATTDVASLPCVFLTDWYAFQMAGLKSGETALIHAAGSGVGMAGIQLAKSLGPEFSPAQAPMSVWSEGGSWVPKRG